MIMTVGCLAGNINVNRSLLTNPLTRESYPLELIVRVAVIARLMGWMSNLSDWE